MNKNKSKKNGGILDNLIRDKRGDLDLRKIFFFVFVFGIFAGFVYLISAIPTLSTPVLNSTTVNNFSSENLTVFTDQDSNTSLKLIYDWKVGGSSIISFNMHFEGDKLCEGNTTICDYGETKLNMSTVGTATYNATGGRDGKGAYEIPAGAGNYLTSEPDEIDLSGDEITIMQWYKGTNYQVGFRQQHNAINNWIILGHGATCVHRIRNNNANLEDTVSCTNSTGDSTIEDGEWHHIAFTWKRNTVNGMIAYVDGVAVDNVSTKDMALPLVQEHVNLGAWNTEFGTGTWDEVMVFKRALSSEQIAYIYSLNGAQPNKIVSQETKGGEVWQVDVTPNDNIIDGTTVSSNNFTIAGANIDSLVLNSTLGTNLSNENLTVFPINLKPSGAKVFYNWKKNGVSIKLFDMPMDGETLCDNSGTPTICDYIGGRNATPTSSGAIQYLPTGGYSGTGVFSFDGDDVLNVNPDLNIVSSFSVTSWVRRGSIGTSDRVIFSTGEADLVNRDFHMGFRTSNIAFCDFQGNSLETSTTLTDTLSFHQVVCTYDFGTNERKMYLDGLLIGTDTASADPDLDAVGETLIGRRSMVAGSYFTGVIDDVVVWNRTLSAEQVFALYNNRTDLIVSQETIYGDVWSVSATPNDNTANGITVSSNNLTIPGIGIGLSSTSGTNLTTENLTASVSGLITGDKTIYDWKLDGSSIAVLNMPMDGGALGSGATVKDYSDNGNNGTVTGGAVYNATGGYDGLGAFEFDGTDDYIALSSDLSSTLGGTATLTAWVKTTQTGNINSFEAPGITGSEVSSGGTDIVWGWIDSTGRMGIRPDDGNSAKTDVMNDGNWHHVAFTRNHLTGEIKAYLDGVLSDTKISDTGLKTAALNDIGRVFDYAAATHKFFDGTIDEITVWNRVLGAEQISAIYNNRTDLIVSQETIYNDVWSVSATPNNNILDGNTVNSGNLTIPGIGISFSSSSGSNLNSDSLTASVSGLITGDREIYNWEKDGSSVMLLNMPMDGGLICNGKVCDYSSYGKNGTLGNDTIGNSAEPAYQSTGGFDGKGNYFFDGTDDWINMNPDIKTNATSFTISAWAKRLGFNANNTIFSDGNTAATNQQLYMGFNEDNKFVCGFYQNDLVTSSTYTSNDWHYWACTYNTQTNNRTIYRDGIVVASDISSADVVTPAVGETAIGKFTVQGNPSPGIGQWFFQGFIDEVIFFDRDLSAEQISSIYNGGASSYRTNVIVNQETFYGDTWSMCATPIDGTSNENGNRVCSSNLTITSPTITLNSTLGTNTSDENLTAFVSGLSTDDKAIYNWKRGGSSIAVLNMPFDGGALLENETKIKDYSGNVNNGTVVNGTTYNATGGYDGKGAYDFDGVNDYINVGDTSSLSSIEDGGSLSLWVRSNVNLSASGNHGLIDSAPLATGSIRIWDVGANLVFGMGGGSEITWPFDSSWIDEWHYVVATLEKQVNITITLYVDGEQKVQEVLPLETTLVNLLDIGRVNNGDYWDGTIDEVVVWNRTLTAEQVSALYNNRTDLIVSQETVYNETWQACATPNDNKFDGTEVCSSNLTLVIVPITSITSSITPLAVVNGTNVTIDFDVAGDEQSKSANLTHVNGTIITLTSFPSTFSNTGDIGRYNVTFYANDTLGNSLNLTDFFETFGGVTFNFTIIDFNTIGVNSTWELSYRDVIITSNGTNSSEHNLTSPDTLVTLKIKSQVDRLQITLRDINVSLENGKTFGMDKHTEVSEFLVTYGVNNSYNFTNATVRIFYDDLSFSDENNLQLHKCDNYNFTGRGCLGSFSDTTSSATQNTVSDYFEFEVTSFSGFGIKEVTPTTTTSSGSFSSSGSGGCASGYKKIGLECVKIAEEVEGGKETIPSQLFDITLSLDDSLIQSSDELSVVVTFESFGLEPTPINLTFIILDEAGNEYAVDKEFIVVITEEVFRKKFESLNLPKGKYTLVLQTLYNVDVFDEFKVEFEIGKERRGITGLAIGFVKGEGKWYLAGAVGLILIAISVWLIIRAYKRRKNSL